MLHKQCCFLNPRNMLYYFYFIRRFNYGLYVGCPFQICRWIQQWTRGCLFPGRSVQWGYPKISSQNVPSRVARCRLEQASSGTQNTQTTGDIVFYVHGYNNSQKTVLERQRKLQRGLESNGFAAVVVSFDWPSADNVLNYLEDRHDVKNQHWCW